MAIKINRNPFKFLNNTAKIQMMKLKLAANKGQVTKLRNRLHEIQQSSILRSSEGGDTRYKGNQYASYSAAVMEIDKKYSGEADWGVLQTGNIIDLRAAFIINQGIKVVRKKAGEGDAEIEWANKFLEYNDLDKEVAQEYAVEAEIEGRIALKLAPEEIETPTVKGKTDKKKTEKETMISVRYVSWTDKQYKIETAPQDYKKFIKMTWTPKDADKEEVLEEPQFVYKKFGGRISKPEKPAPKMMKCLTQIDNLDKALTDWREINRIFSAPILNVKCEDEEDLKWTKEALTDKNWKVKKIFVSTALMAYVVFDIKGIDSLEREIITLAKIISGTTGVPVHFLGFTDILKQVTTAKNLMESVKAATNKERETWKGAYDEVITKAMLMHNEASGNNQQSKGKRLDPSLITVEIPFITEDEWDHLINFYLPAAMARLIAVETLHSKTPGLDTEKEKELQIGREESELDEAKRDRDRIRKDLEDKNLEEEDEE